MKQSLKDMLKRLSESEKNFLFEWTVEPHYEEDTNCNGVCACGQHGLRYLYKIRNLVNENTLYPIGSKCIKEFGSSIMTHQINVIERIHETAYGNAKPNNNEIVNWMHSNGLVNEREFTFLDNMRRKRSFTEAQLSWYNALMDKIRISAVVVEAMMKLGRLSSTDLSEEDRKTIIGFVNRKIKAHRTQLKREEVIRK